LGGVAPAVARRPPNPYSPVPATGSSTGTAGATHVMGYEWRVEVLYYRHQSSLEHDPAALYPDHPDSPERIAAIEYALQLAGWPGCSRREAPAANLDEIELVHGPMLIRSIRRLAGMTSSRRPRSDAGQ
jgi:hypothetical protein